MASSETKKLVRRRAYVKGLITCDINKIKSLSDDQLNKHLLDEFIHKIDANLVIVEEFDASICETASDAELDSFLQTSRDYHFDVQKSLSEFRLKLENLVGDKKTPQDVPSKIVKLPLPPIQISPFENNATNPFAYFNFKKSFNNALAGMPNLTKAQKFVYLKGYLLGEALNVVENITVNNEGFDLAFEQLDFNFLDVDNIIDKVLSEILQVAEAKSLNEVESLVRTLNNKFIDLKGLSVNLLEDNSAALLLTSKIVNGKLPRSFLIELSRETGSTYPNFNQLLSNYQNILARLRLGHNENTGAKPKVKFETKDRSSDSFKPVSKSITSSEPNKVKAFSKVTSMGKCKFCREVGHTSSKCSKFESLQARKNRAEELTLCTRCLSDRHKTFDCPGIRASLPYKCFSCGKSEHHGAMCPQANKDNGKKILNCQSGSEIFVPILSLRINKGKKSVKCCFLLDTGAQFSIINKQFVDSQLGNCCGAPLTRLVSSFGLPASVSKGFNLIANLTLPCGEKSSCLFFALENFSLSLQIPMLPSVVKNMESAGYSVSPNYPGRNSEIVNILGILGNDILQEFTQFDLSHVELFNFNVRVIKLANGIIPFGSVVNFVHPSQRRQFFKRISDSCEPCVSDLPVRAVESCPLVSSNKVLDNSPSSSGKIKSVRFVPNKEINCVPEHHVESRVFYNSYLNQETRQTSNPVDCIKLPEFVPPKQLGKQKLLVNFAVNPVGYKFDPLLDIFPNASVEYGLDNFYNLESIGIKDENSPCYEDQQVSEFAKSISFYDGHYHVQLPWKKDLIEKVPSNLKIALAVAERVYAKLEIQNISSKYEDVFTQQEMLGIIEPVKVRTTGQVFIPHRPVIRTDEHTTTKIRPVFNCSLKVGKAPSLNEAAFPGIDLMNNLLSLLLYFRNNDYVVLADIVKAFLQIRLSSELDRNRFCFFRKINGKFVAYRYNTIIFGFVSSPFILNYIIQHHLSSFKGSEVASLIRDKFYVDNLVLSSNMGIQLPFFINTIKDIMNSGGLPLREWGSNCPALLSSLDEDEKVTSSEMKILGYIYNSDQDTLQLKVKQLNKDASSKRQILSALSSVFDPIGIFNPVMLQGKLIIRKLCQQVVDWDDLVSPEISKLWSRFVSTYSEVSQTSFSRKTFNSDAPVKLFLFADASKEAFACVMYAVQDGNSSLIFAKTKVSPVKERTLPTLELLAAQLALKCFDTIFENNLICNTKFESITLFIDSQVVLSWVLTNRAPKRNTFVNNRLKEISCLLESISNRFCRVSLAYIPSAHNQADLLTKPCTSKHFLENFSTWVKGPSWLRSSSDEWPKGQLGCIPSNVKGDLISPVMFPNKEPLVNISDFSSFSRLIGVVSKFFTAVYKFRKSQADPVVAATNYLMKVMQEEAFPLELAYLKDKNSSAEIPPLVKQFNLFLDDHGIMRTKGRIDKNVELKYNIVNPILVDKKHHLTSLLIYYAHCKSMHMGLQSTLSFLRMHGLWIVKARQAVLSVLKNCIVCKRYNARSVRYPSPASLPSSRVNLSVPFAHTGVDYTGHLWLRDKNGERVKSYILIFTCFNTRAIHLEVVQSMTTSEFILAFIRFSNRFGVPSAVYSDNAKSFVQAGNIIEQLLTSSEFEEKFRVASITHRTIPVYAAWYGAVWERLIKTVKYCLFKTLGRFTPSFSEFVTFLSDIQKILNNRPLTYRSCENELDIISPNHFLVGRSIPSLMFGDSEQVPEWEYSEEDDYSSHLARTLEIRDGLYENFKEKWLAEYLVNLREKDRATFHPPREWEKGEIALFRLPSKARSYWPLVRIVETFCDDEGIVRTVRIVKSDRSESNVNVSHLIPLELYSELNDPNLYVQVDEQEENINDSVEDETLDTGTTLPEISTARPSRSTALASREQIRTLAREGRL